MNDLQVPQQVAVATNNILKYYRPFYICPASLFNNRQLKRKRRKWAQNDYSNKAKKKKKTENEPSLTINLLSDEDDDDDDVDEAQNEHQSKVQKLWLEQQTQQMLKNIQSIYGNPMLLKAVSSTEPPPLVPLSTTAAKTLKKVNKNSNLQHGLLMYSKTKAIAKKRNAAPVLLNTESIVLSDDSDAEFITTSNKSPSLSLLPELTLTAIKNNNNNSNHDKSLNSSEEEVTVSLVPRHTKSNAQQLKNQKATTTTNSNVEVFPMLPDETIVHTVIANRTYELSLTKLREGLAQGEQTSPNNTKDGGNTPESAQAQISLKLSSDLSISLISDDEEEEDENQECVSNTERAELLRRQQPQLSVQQVNLAASTSKQPPKRRKLG